MINKEACNCRGLNDGFVSVEYLNLLETRDIGIANLIVSNILDDSELLELACKVASKVKCITVQGAQKETITGLEMLLSSFTGLQEIHMPTSVHLTDQTLMALHNHAETLSVINFAGCTRVTDTGMVSLLSQCVLLRKLNLHGCRLTDEVLEGLMNISCSALQVLDLALNTFYTPSTLVALLTKCTNLTSLNLDSLTTPNYAPFDEETDANGNDSGDFSDELNVFEMDHNQQQNDDDDDQQDEDEEDEENDDDGVAVGAEPTPSSRPKPVRRGRPLGPTSTVTGDVMETIIACCQRLRVLNVSGSTFVSSEHFEQMCRQMPALADLNVSRCSHVNTGVCIASHSLTRLNLSACTAITDDDVMVLAVSCERLQDLNLKACKKITDYSVTLIVCNCNALRALD
eukprot:gene38094-47011_t